VGLELTEKAVVGTQNITDNCFVCGINNTLGVHARFFNLDDGSVCALFVAREEHQGYAGRVHGGILSAVLDETIGRAVQVRSPDTFGVTIELTVKYRKPAPLGEELRAVGRIDREARRLFEGSGELLLPDGTVAVEATAKYVRLEIENIVEGGLDEVGWLADDRPAPETIVT